MLVYKDGITRTILTNEWRKFEEIGYIQVEEMLQEATRNEIAKVIKSEGLNSPFL